MLKDLIITIAILILLVEIIGSFVCIQKNTLKQIDTVLIIIEQANEIK